LTEPNNIVNTSVSEKQTSMFKVSKYILLADIYFFFNALFLPKGLLYTLVLSPYFFYRQLVNKRQTWWQVFIITLLVFDTAHLFIGVDVFTFVKSNIYFVLTYFSLVSVYHFINHYAHLEKIIKHVLLFNFILAMVAIPFFFMEPTYQDWFWWVNREALSKHEFPRLKLFTYEASYYSLIMVPVLYFYVFKFLFGQIKLNKYQTLLLILIPILMSMSFGVIGATLLSALIMALIFYKQLLKYKKPFIIGSSILGLIILGVFVLFLFFPESSIALRLLSIFSGTDTSANGRTSDSFGIAWGLIESKNRWFGIGLGQVKIQIESLIREEYSYWGNYTRYDIPNAVAETLAIFGITGLMLRIGLQLFLFFRTKVYANYYQLALFLFVFIYQFTGSFITNIVEYVIWILAFSNVFKQFDVKIKAN
jgi:hypothetical protein